MQVCAMTMVHNERFNLPIWLRHYGAQVGPRNLLVIDHGSTDGSTDSLGLAGCMRIPREERFDDRGRARFIQATAMALLRYYGAVIYSDCDEMLVADPARYATLAEFCAAVDQPVINAIGLNLRQDITREGRLDLRRPILRQRSFVQFVSPMCKPLVIRAPIHWGGGFHCCDRPPFFDDLYLFHLRYADLEAALDRLAITRSLSFGRAGAATHQRRTDVEMVFTAFAQTHQVETRDDWDFARWLDAHLNSFSLSHLGHYQATVSTFARVLHRIPERFADIF